MKPTSRPKVPHAVNNVPKTAFVVMPIGETGSADYEHFGAIYREHISPAIREAGFDPKRADDTHAPGHITAELLQDLIDAPLVLVDVTSLNPNVFYELGVRHAIARGGTVLLCDKVKTPRLPFDVFASRAIFYDSSTARIGKLRADLVTAIKACIAKREPDSPVHLLSNAPMFKTGRISEASSSALDGQRDPIAVFDLAIEEAVQQRLPRDLLELCQQAVRDEDMRAFLEASRELLTTSVLRPTERELLQLHSLGRRASVDSSLTRAMLDISASRFPDSMDIRHRLLIDDLKAPKRETREAARSRIFDLLCIKLDGNKLKQMPSGVSTSSYDELLPLLLDALHSDQQNELALQITAAMTARDPNSTVALRNHARAIQRMGNSSSEEVDKAYINSIHAPDVDDTTAMWLGGHLAEKGRLIDALETVAFGLLLDLDESKSFATFALMLSNITSPRNVVRSLTEDSRQLPAAISGDSVVTAILCAESCDNYGVDTKFICEAAMNNSGITVEVIQESLDTQGRPTRHDRLKWAKNVHDALVSDLTRPQTHTLSQK